MLDGREAGLDSRDEQLASRTARDSQRLLAKQDELSTSDDALLLVFIFPPIFPSSPLSFPHPSSLLVNISLSLSASFSISFSQTRNAPLLMTCSYGHTLQLTATHCNSLPHTATYCNSLQLTATHCDLLQLTATHCHPLRLTATHCNSLQLTATHCIEGHLQVSWPHTTFTRTHTRMCVCVCVCVCVCARVCVCVCVRVYVCLQRCDVASTCHMNESRLLHTAPCHAYKYGVQRWNALEVREADLKR